MGQNRKFEVGSTKPEGGIGRTTCDFVLPTSYFSSPEGAAAAAGRLGVRIVEHEPFADHVRVVVEHRAVQVQETLLIDENLRALRPLEDCVAQPRLFLSRERVAQTRA